MFRKYSLIYVYSSDIPKLLISQKKLYLDPPPPINFVDAIHATLGYNWLCGHSSRPPSLS